MESITIGKHTFSADYLRSVTLTEAKARFKHVKPDLVKQAYYQANPKRKRKSKDA